MAGHTNSLIKKKTVFVLVEGSSHGGIFIARVLPLTLYLLHSLSISQNHQKYLDTLTCFELIRIITIGSGVEHQHTPWRPKGTFNYLFALLYNYLHLISFNLAHD
ncbi:hypothetical protein N665_0255s0058 [Sinapis alba]|nr:hypothetical protein N665_0255s0058 [Sinapis alba]